MGKGGGAAIGYWYKLLLHFGWCRGPIDAFLEMRGGDRTAWAGVLTESGTITISARELWGGEQTEGGIEGDADVMFGEATQTPNAYLAASLGPNQTAYRGRAGFVFKGGLYGAMNPYPKAASFKILRILKGWPDDAPWYPAKAAIALSEGTVTYTAIGYFAILTPTQQTTGNPGGLVQPMTGTAMEIAQAAVVARNLAYVEEYGPGAQQVVLTSATFGSGVVVGFGNDTNNTYPSDVGIVSVAVSAVCPAGYTTTISPDGQSVACTMTSSDLVGANPAHMLYDSITNPEKMGEPTALIDLPSFTAAADKLFAEGLGLCTTQDPKEEDVERFQSRICNVIGGVLSQSRVDGKYYLELLRGDYVLDSLPILGDDDILEYREEGSDPLESVNQVSVEYFDVEMKQKRSTTPLQALGSIQTVGGILADTVSYPEIAIESLALRLAARDLKNKATPLKRFTLTTTRKPFDWRPGTYFRLQAPRRGIADMVCLLGEVSAGTPRSGSMRLVAVQDIFTMPTVTYVDAEPGVDTNPSTPPTPPEFQAAIEAPYVELAGYLAAADLAALDPDAGYLVTVAKEVQGSLNYDVWTARDDEPYANSGRADWTPVLEIVEAGLADPAQTSFTFTGGNDLDTVAIGTAALWGDEVVRIDAMDVVAGTITLARGCGDTVPREHLAGLPLWCYDEWYGSDQRAYLTGEVAHAKLLTRGVGATLPLGAADPLDVTMDQRQARPYPPAAVLVDGAWPAPALVSDGFDVTWVHRDRILQANMLVEWSAASIGPEPGTNYQVRIYDASDDSLLHDSGLIIATTWSVPALPFSGDVVLEVRSERDVLECWQPVEARFYYDGVGDVRLAEDGAPRMTESGTIRTLEG